jgi:hypothetical protein
MLLLVLLLLRWRERRGKHRAAACRGRRHAEHVPDALLLRNWEMSCEGVGVRGVGFSSARWSLRDSPRRFRMLWREVCGDETSRSILRGEMGSEENVGMSRAEMSRAGGSGDVPSRGCCGCCGCCCRGAGVSREGRTKRPCMGAQEKYAVPSTLPSLRPTMASISTPHHKPCTDKRGRVSKGKRHAWHRGKGRRDAPS